ncbi:hypothetical protein BJ508DRAFT_413784 [Ascobolus immersus RN42]|uniref:Uncharacterized protein n=1 Tax=Ascobolus immersus RN42 TaxID=1160509 RepID=A0A3N4IF88_ASCIM|nr:hypothetical protein BJ508DRAFT_413784 [Ascobolus immersus RN42]
MGLKIISAFGRTPNPYLAIILAQIISQVNSAALPETHSPVHTTSTEDTDEDDDKKKDGVSMVFKIVLPIVLVIIFIVFVWSFITHRNRKRVQAHQDYEANASPTERYPKPMDAIMRIRKCGRYAGDYKETTGSKIPILSQPSPHSPGPISPPPQAHNLRISQPGSRASHRSRSPFPDASEFPPVYVSPSHRQTSFEGIQVLPISNISSPIQSPTAFNGTKNSVGGKAPSSPPAYSDRSFSRASEHSRMTSVPPTYENITSDSATDISSTPTPSVRAAFPQH